MSPSRLSQPGSNPHSMYSNDVSTQRYHDNVISLFQCDDIEMGKVQNLIKDQISLNKDNTWKAHGLSLNYCLESLNIVSDLCKLQIYFNDSVELSTLDYYVNVKFEVDHISCDLYKEQQEDSKPHILASTLKQLQDDVYYPQWKYKNNAMQCINKCNKLLLGLDALDSSLTDIRLFIETNIDDILRDPMTLLYEIWLHLLNKFKWFRIHILNSFVKAKCLMINFELQLFTDFITMNSKYYESYPDFHSDVVTKLQNTIHSFNGYIKNILSNMDNSIHNHDEKLYNESFASFLDMEVMYNQLNLDWLIPQTTEESEEKKDINSIDHPSTRHYLNPDPKEIGKLEHISEYVDNIIELPEAETPLNSPGYRTQIYPHNDSHSPSITQSFKDTINSSSVRITRELPHLLNAFNNVKRLENDIENSSKYSLHTVTEDPNKNTISPKSNVYTPKAKKRSQSISSSVSTSSTLYSNYAFPSSSTSATASTLTSTAKLNENDTDMNFKSMYSSMGPANQHSGPKLDSAYRVSDDTSRPITAITAVSPLSSSSPSLSQMYISESSSLSLNNPSSICGTNPLSVSTSMVSHSQLLRNDLRKLVSLQEQLPVMKNQTIVTKRSFGSSPLKNSTRNISGFHSILLNNLYGVRSSRSQDTPGNPNHNISKPKG